MSTLDALLDRIIQIHQETDLATVRTWKAGGSRRKAIGCLPVYVPRELIHAAGMLPVSLVGQGDLEIIRGDAYFQSYICHLPRSVIEQGVSGKLDCLEGLIFPAICDVIRNLSGMWKLMFPGTYVKYLDVPQNFDPEVGGRFYHAELDGLRRDLSSLAGVDVTDVALSRSLQAFNENRRMIERLYSRRAEAPWLHPSTEVYRLMAAGRVLPVEEHTDLIGSYLELAAGRSLRAMDHVRVLVSGAFCEQPPIDLIRTIEAAGCSIVEDDFFLGSRWIQGDIVDRGDPLRSLADAYLDQSTNCPSRYDEHGKNGHHLVEKARTMQVDGVILCAPSFCDPSLLEQPVSVSALDEAHIPYTSFKYAENNGQFQVIREQAGTFSDSIRLWGEG